jgi:iron complex transport system substrate-binding protein
MTRRTPRRRSLLLLLLPALLPALLLAAGCGDDDDGGGASGPSTTAAAEDAPERIVSLSAVATEILFAIDAGDSVIAVDDQSNHPPEAPRTDLSGFQPNIEAIAGYDPDLVVISYDPGELQSGLEELGITVLMHDAAATLDEAYAQMRELGDVTGRREEADALVAGMQADIEELTASVPAHTRGMTYYHELDETLFSVTSDTFLGAVYGLLGMTSIADAVPDQAGGFPQLSAEYVIEADPDVILLADTKCCGQTAETVEARPGWSEITAVRAGAVVELDDDIASRWGPRIVDLLRAVVERLSALEPVAAGG